MTRLGTAIRTRLSAAQRDAGFTVLEVLVAFTLFVAVSAAATYSIVNAVNASHLSQQRADAAGVATSYISQAASNASTVGSENGAQYSASISNEQFSVLRWITFSGGGDQCAHDTTFTVVVVVKQQQTGKFLARSDSVIACPG
jgi:type II secretory pathway pseudopilin PulG